MFNIHKKVESTKILTLSILVTLFFGGDGGWIYIFIIKQISDQELKTDRAHGATHGTTQPS